MGEAKRRKQLGLMPTVYPFEVQLAEDGKVTFLKALQDAKLAQLVAEKLEQTQLTGQGWASEYRSNLVFTGQVPRRLSTVQEVNAIAVPPLRRIVGEVVLGKQVQDIAGAALPIAGGVIRFREQSFSFDGEKWASFPQLRPERIFEAIQTHPAFNLEGEKIGQYRVEQFAEGRIDIDPEPPAGTLELLEEVGREWHGLTSEEWAAYHLEQLAGKVEGNQEIPVAKRSFFELRSAAPLQHPLRNPFGVRGEIEVYPLVDSSYSLDGHAWLKYEDPTAEAEEDDFLQAFNEMLNMETVQVTVYADGRVEWTEGDIPAGRTGRVRRELVEATGAGDPEKWAEWTRQMLLDTFNAEAEGEIPVPVGVKLDLAKDALEDEEPLSHTFIESEVTFDGEVWRDLYDEEVPQELLLAIANMKPAQAHPAEALPPHAQPTQAQPTPAHSTQAQEGEEN